MSVELWTIGHSTRSAELFLECLQSFSIEALADVRRFPGSRRFPHFSQETLALFLHEHGIDYVHFPELGGRRKASADSLNTAWRHEAFRGYADYMETTEFERGAARLEALAGEKRSAVMCAEQLWWQCHRGLIADWMKARGVAVWNISAPGKAELHPFTSPARVVHGKLSYRELL